MYHTLTITLEFLYSPELPKICVVYGTTENITVQVAHSARDTRRFNAQDLPLPFSPEGWAYWQVYHAGRSASQGKNGRTVQGVLILCMLLFVLQRFLFPGLWFFTFPCIVVSIAAGVGLWKMSHGPKFTRPPWGGPVDVGHEMLYNDRQPVLRMHFPAKAEALYHIFEAAHQAFQARVASEQLQPNPPHPA